MKVRSFSIDVCWAIEKGEWGWDFLIAIPHIEIRRLPLSTSNDWCIDINVFFGMITIGWEILKQDKQIEGVINDKTKT